MQNLGLASAPNTNVKSQSSSSSNSQQNIMDQDGNNSSSKSSSCKAIELYDIPESDAFLFNSNTNNNDENKKQKWTNMPMSVDNQKYIIRCFEKYGDDYKKMSRDIQLNDMQHTENKLRKMGARFLLLSESQRKVDIPEKIQHLVISSN